MDLQVGSFARQAHLVWKQSNAIPYAYGVDVNHVVLTSEARDSVYAVFAAGADGIRDIMFNNYTTIEVYLPLIMR